MVEMVKEAILSLLKDNWQLIAMAVGGLMGAGMVIGSLKSLMIKLFTASVEAGDKGTDKILTDKGLRYAVPVVLLLLVFGAQFNGGGKESQPSPQKDTQQPSQTIEARTPGTGILRESDLPVFSSPPILPSQGGAPAPTALIPATESEELAPVWGRCPKCQAWLDVARFSPDVLNLDASFSCGGCGFLSNRMECWIAVREFEMGKPPLCWIRKPNASLPVIMPSKEQAEFYERTSPFKKQVPPRTDGQTKAD